METILNESSHLFAKPSFVTGMGSVIDIGATLQSFNYTSNATDADAKAISSDWVAVGKDLNSSINNYVIEKK